MTRFPALALIELDSVAVGIRAADLMVKRAPIALLKAGTVHPGHYLVLIAGSVAAVTESYQAGLDAGEEAGRALGQPLLLDQVLLPEVHPQVHDAALGARFALELDSLGVLETRTVASVLRAADAAVKGARVRIAEIRMADDLGGRAFVLFDGLVADIEAALDIGSRRVPRELLFACTEIPRLDATVRTSLSASTYFRPGPPLAPDGAEPARTEMRIGTREDPYFGK
jgi:microcompartment protein CcmL/EutN